MLCCHRELFHFRASAGLVCAVPVTISVSNLLVFSLWLAVAVLVRSRAMSSALQLAVLGDWELQQPASVCSGAEDILYPDVHCVYSGNHFTTVTIKNSFLANFA